MILTIRSPSRNGTSWSPNFLRRLDTTIFEDWVNTPKDFLESHNSNDARQIQFATTMKLKGKACVGGIEECLR